MRGQDQISLQRDNTSYTNSSRGQFTRQFEESGHFNKLLSDYVLSNKFQYGYDANGGRNYASKESQKNRMIEYNEITKIVQSVTSTNSIALLNKANDAK